VSRIGSPEIRRQRSTRDIQPNRYPCGNARDQVAVRQRGDQVARPCYGHLWMSRATQAEATQHGKRGTGVCPPARSLHDSNGGTRSASGMGWTPLSDSFALWSKQYGRSKRSSPGTIGEFFRAPGSVIFCGGAERPAKRQERSRQRKPGGWRYPEGSSGDRACEVAGHRPGAPPAIWIRTRFVAGRRPRTRSRGGYAVSSRTRRNRRVWR